MPAHAPALPTSTYLRPQVASFQPQFAQAVNSVRFAGVRTTQPLFTPSFSYRTQAVRKPTGARPPGSAESAGPCRGVVGVAASGGWGPGNCGSVGMLDEVGGDVQRGDGCFY